MYHKSIGTYSLPVATVSTPLAYNSVLLRLRQDETEQRQQEPLLLSLLLNLVGIRRCCGAVAYLFYGLKPEPDFVCSYGSYFIEV